MSEVSAAGVHASAGAAARARLQSSTIQQSSLFSVNGGVNETGLPVKILRSPVLSRSRALGVQRKPVSTMSTLLPRRTATSTARIRTIAGSRVTFRTQTGAQLTLSVPSQQLRVLGFRPGTLVRVIRVHNGFRIINLTRMRSMVGEGVVRHVAIARTEARVTFANRTGLHTLILSRLALARLHLQAGTTVAIRLINPGLIRITALGSGLSPQGAR
jgi:hypothetical protein